MKATIWHNPRCSKSREALARLNAVPDAEVSVVEYLKEPPTREALAELLAAAGLTPREALRTKEPEAKALADARDDTILDAMIRFPVLIERPLVRTDKGVRLARPTDRLDEIL